MKGPLPDAMGLPTRNFHRPLISIRQRSRTRKPRRAGDEAREAGKEDEANGEKKKDIAGRKNFLASR